MSSIFWTAFLFVLLCISFADGAPAVQPNELDESVRSKGAKSNQILSPRLAEAKQSAAGQSPFAELNSPAATFAKYFVASGVMDVAHASSRYRAYLDTAGNAWQWNGEQYLKISTTPSFGSISYGSDGELWATGSQPTTCPLTYRWNATSASWTQHEGCCARITVGSAANILCLSAGAQQLYTGNTLAIWSNIQPGSGSQNIGAIGSDGDIWSIGGTTAFEYFTSNSQLGIRAGNSQQGQFIHVLDSNRVFLTNTAGHVFRYNRPKDQWDTVNIKPFLAQKFYVGEDGSVALLTPAGNLLVSNLSPSSVFPA